MNIQSMENKVIRLSQIINRHQARYRIRFKSEKELSDPEIWRKIINHRAAFAHFEATVIDQTPEENIDDLKKFTIIYGLKYLFAAEMLNLETIPVKVLKNWILLLLRSSSTPIISACPDMRKASLSENF